MTPEIKHLLWTYFRGLGIGLLIGCGFTTTYWSHRVHAIAEIQQAVERQLDSVKRVCEGKPPMRGVSFRATADPSTIQIFVLDGPRLIIKIPNVKKDDLAGIVASFFSRGDEQAEAKFKELLPQAKQITLIVTTESGKEKP